MQETVSSTPDKYNLASLFAGVGGIELGFEQTGEFSTVYANEFDEKAQVTYRNNFEDVSLDERDIRTVEHYEVPDVDVITGGFPCQAFSVAGYRKGFEDERGDLFFDLLRIIKNKEPRVIFIENVKNMVTHDHGNTFKVIREAFVMNGYYISWKVLNSADYGNIPQNRERIYIVGFRDKKDFDNFNFPKSFKLQTSIHDVIDFSTKKDEKYYYREGKQTFYDILEEDITSQNTIYQWRRKYVRENKSGLVPTLTANMGTGGHNVPLILTGYGIRKLTPRETFNVQGYPTDYTLPDIANSHLYKQAGNSVTVPVIKRVADKIVEALEKNNKPEDNGNIPQSKDKYAVIYVDMQGRYEGESFVKEYFTDIESAKSYIKDYSTSLTPFLTDDEYIRLVNKGQDAKFYMLEQL